MRRILACAFLISAVTACGGKPAMVTEIAPLVPYQTSTPSETPSVIPPLIVIILPTPTTFTYTVVLGDTLNGIAGRFGITLEALVAANPGVQPSTLPVGTILIIPPSSTAPGNAQPTPAPLLVKQAHCWIETDGGLWCFALVQNDNAGTLENISARFTLLDASGKELTSQAAFALLDTLPSGKSLPLAAHFPPPIQTIVNVRLQVLTSILLLTGDLRYLPVVLEDTLVDMDASGRTAQLTGLVRLTGAGTAKTTWVLATAYDAAGNVIGLRRWESTTPLTADAPIPFGFLLSSVGPPIDRVEFLAEARP